MFSTLILIINIPHDVWIWDNIFMNNYTLDECTHRCITYCVTAHPDDGQTRPKHVGATNWESIYHLCILLAFTGNCTTMHGVTLFSLCNSCWFLYALQDGRLFLLDAVIQMSHPRTTQYKSLSLTKLSLSSGKWVTCNRETARISKTSENVYQTTRRHLPEDANVRSPRRNNLKSRAASTLALPRLLQCQLPVRWRVRASGVLLMGLGLGGTKMREVYACENADTQHATH